MKNKLDKCVIKPKKDLGSHEDLCLEFGKYLIAIAFNENNLKFVYDKFIEERNV